MPMATKSLRDRLPEPTPHSSGLRAADDYLGRFREIADMIALLDNLSDLADDISSRRALRQAREFAVAFRGQNPDLLRAYHRLDPLTRRAFEAVVAGLDRLAESAADLCGEDGKPLTSIEREACAEIGRSMRQLLRRAAALVESAEAPEAGASRADAANFAHEPHENKN